MNSKLYIVFLLFFTTLSSSAWAGDLIGKVSEPNGKPVAGAVVAVSDEKHEALTALTDNDGHFRFRDIPQGEYGITASAPAAGAAFLGKVAIPVSDLVENVELVLAGNSISLTGHVHSSRTSLPSDLKIEALRTSDEVGDSFHAEITGNEFRLSVLPGKYVLVAKAQGWSGQTRYMKFPADQEKLDIWIHPDIGSDPKLADEILAMEKADQDARNRVIDHPTDAVLLAEEIAVDAKNAARIAQIIHEKGWPSADLVGPKASFALFVMVLHAPGPLQKECLPMMKLAAAHGELSLRNLATIIDKDLVYDGKKQLYGTQLRGSARVTTDSEFQPIEDEAHVDQRRAEMGMSTLAEYKAELIRDTTPRTEQSTPTEDK
jgi:hypothetical protein